MVRHTDQRRILSLHVAVGVVVPGCLALAWWQVTRALSGNTLSWAYVFEWPIFAGYALFMWWKLTHEAASAGAGGTKNTAHGGLGAPALPAATESRGSLEEGPHTAGHRPATEEGGPYEDGGRDGDDFEEELAAYNEYLAALNASGRRKHW
jgi:hypothetical protein